MSERNKEEVVSSEKKWPNWNEKIYEREHTITPKMKRFILLFVSKGEGKTIADFAKLFKVHPSTITVWLALPEVKEEINRLLEDAEARIMSLLESRQEELVRGLLKMFQNEELNPETRRRIAYDLLSFGRLKDINKGVKTIVAQQTVVNQYENMSDEELDEALKEIEELENG